MSDSEQSSAPAARPSCSDCPQGGQGRPASGAREPGLWGQSHRQPSSIHRQTSSAQRCSTVGGDAELPLRNVLKHRDETPPQDDRGRREAEGQCRSRAFRTRPPRQTGGRGKKEHREDKQDEAKPAHRFAPELCPQKQKTHRQCGRCEQRDRDEHRRPSCAEEDGAASAETRRHQGVTEKNEPSRVAHEPATGTGQRQPPSLLLGGEVDRSQTAQSTERGRGQGEEHPERGHYGLSPPAWLPLTADTDPPGAPGTVDGVNEQRRGDHNAQQRVVQVPKIPAHGPSGSAPGAQPASRSKSRRSAKTARADMSRRCSGSSRTRSLLGRTSTAARARRRRCPDESRSGIASLTASRPNAERSGSRIGPSSTPCPKQTMLRCSRTLRAGKKASSPRSRATAVRCEGEAGFGFFPMSRTYPSIGGCSPRQVRRNVDFPAPLTPTTKTAFLGLTLRSMGAHNARPA